MPDYISISFTNVSTEQKEILIAQLAEIGFEGFEEHSDGLSAFIKEEDYDERLTKHTIVGMQISFSKQMITERNWNAQWEKSFVPVQLDDFCVIRAAFHAPLNGVKHDIIVTPKMSFGTGHHATTFMMIQLIRRVNFNEKIVLDFGTGTGILAILAERLGAARIDAIDHDEWSISNATENILLNNCTKIHLHKGSTIVKENHYDIILANINKNVLLANMSSIKQHLQTAGVVLMSGVLAGDDSEMKSVAAEHGLALVEQIELQGWLALQLNHIICCKL